MVQEINTIQDVTTFIEEVAREIGDYNPFTYFDSYIDPATNQPKYTPEEAQQRNALLDKCFEICAQQEGNFINLSLVVFEEAREVMAYMQGSRATVELQAAKANECLLLAVSQLLT